MLTIIMYHYVRDSHQTKWPEIKGLNLKEFSGQLDYIQKHYSVVSLKDVIIARKSGGTLPKNSCHLSFDDGLKDHIESVAPELKRRNLIASFYPIASATLKNKVLDVHKIHYIIGTGIKQEDLNQELLCLLDKYRKEHNLPSNTELYEAYSSIPHRYDPPAVVFFKRVLSKGLNNDLREKLVDELFRKYISDKEKEFAQSLYLSLEELKTLKNMGMEIGGHGNEHIRFEQLDASQQQNEIESSLELLEKANTSSSDWLFAYPYGSYTPDSLKILKEKNCGAALTIETDLADLKASLLELPRLNTNDLPFSKENPISDWTLKVQRN